MKSKVWLERIQSRNIILQKGRAKFCNPKFTRRETPISEENIEILNYYLDMEGASFKDLLETTGKLWTLIENEVFENKEDTITTCIDVGLLDKLIKFLDERKIAKYFNVESTAHQSETLDGRKFEFISRNSLNRLQFYTLKIFLEIVSGSIENAEYVVSLGCIEKIAGLLKNDETPIENLKFCVWTLGNACEKSADYIDAIMKEDILPTILRLMSESNDKHFLSLAIFSFGNIIQDYSPENVKHILTSLPTICKIVQNFMDPEILKETCWIIPLMIDRPSSDEIMQNLFDSGVIKTIISQLEIDNIHDRLPILRLLQSLIGMSNPSYKSYVLEAGVLPLLSNVLSSPDIFIKHVCCLLLTNLTSGNLNQIRMLLEAGIIQQLIDLMKIDDELIKKQAYLCVINTCIFPNADIIDYLLERDIVRLFNDGLKSNINGCLGGMLALLKNSKESA